MTTNQTHALLVKALTPTHSERERYIERERGRERDIEREIHRERDT